MFRNLQTRKSAQQEQLLLYFRVGKGYYLCKTISLLLEVPIVYETSKQENGTCDSCGYTSWKYEDSSLPHKEEVCLSSSCRYAMINGRAEKVMHLK